MSQYGDAARRWNDRGKARVFRKIVVREVIISVLMKMEDGKAVGLDGIVVEMLSKRVINIID